MQPASTATILAHVTSLPGPGPVGDLGPAATRFLDVCADVGLDGWQTLPPGPCGAGNSPYSALSSFAGNPLFIAPEPLIEAGWLKREEIPAAPPSVGRVDYAAAERWKRGWLEPAARRLARDAAGRDELRRWLEAPAQDWIPDWTLFAALRGEQRRRPWFRWPRALRDRRRTALAEARSRLAEAVGFHTALQFFFHRQWEGLRAAAANRGIALIGDLPFYPAHDSTDVWCAREAFALTDDGRIARGGGVPPDYFSDEGQLWGTPVIRWERLRTDGDGWWRRRLETQLRLFDAVRLDHFRGYAAFWSVDGSARSAREGRWEAGPGAAIFDGVAEPATRLIAEDLGDIDESVHALRRSLGLPGMAVFPFLPDDEPLGEALEKLPRRTALYTATHDNDTTRGWIDSLSAEERARLLERVGCDGPGAVAAVVERCLASPVETVVLPLQDWLELPSTARMNVPGVADGNWEWRATAEPDRGERERLATRLRRTRRGRYRLGGDG